MVPAYHRGSRRFRHHPRPGKVDLIHIAGGQDPHTGGVYPAFTRPLIGQRVLGRPEIAHYVEPGLEDATAVDRIVRNIFPHKHRHLLP